MAKDIAFSLSDQDKQELRDAMDAIRKNSQIGGPNAPVRKSCAAGEIPSNRRHHPGGHNDGGPGDPCAAEKNLGTVLAHELGHAIGGNDCDSEDDEDTGGHNVCRNENPVRNELSLCNRNSYHGMSLSCEN